VQGTESLRYSNSLLGLQALPFPPPPLLLLLALLLLVIILQPTSISPSRSLPNAKQNVLIHKDSVTRPVHTTLFTLPTYVLSPPNVMLTTRPMNRSHSSWEQDVSTESGTRAFHTCKFRDGMLPLCSCQATTHKHTLQPQQCPSDPQLVGCLLLVLHTHSAVISVHFSQSSISFNMGAHRVQVAHGDLWSPSPPRVPSIATTATASSATTTTAATWHTTQATQPMTKSLGGFQAGLVATYTLPRQMPPHSALTASRHILAAQARRQQLSKHITSPSGMR
jgi:hypothetical protein